MRIKFDTLTAVSLSQKCTRLHQIASQIFKKFPGDNTPDSDLGEGDTLSPGPSPASALRASIRGLRPLDVSTGTSL